MKLLQIGKIHIKLIYPLLRYSKCFAFQWSVHHFFNIKTIIQIGRDIDKIIIDLFTGIFGTLHLIWIVEHLNFLYNLVEFRLVFSGICLLLYPIRILIRRILSLVLLLSIAGTSAFHIVINQEIYLLNIK